METKNTPVPVDEVLAGIVKIANDSHDFAEVAGNISARSYKRLNTTSGMIVGSLLDAYLTQHEITCITQSFTDLNASMISRYRKRVILFSKNLGVNQRIALTLDLFGHLVLGHEIKDYIGPRSDENIDYGIIYEYKQASLHQKVRFYRPDVVRAHEQSAQWASRFVQQHFIGSKDIRNPFVQTAIPVLDFLSKHP